MHHRRAHERGLARSAGNLLELDAITAVIIGGASFFGGRGTSANVLVGALILGVDPQRAGPARRRRPSGSVAIGVILIASVELDVLRGWLEERLRAAQGAAAG